MGGAVSGWLHTGIDIRICVCVLLSPSVWSRYTSATPVMTVWLRPASSRSILRAPLASAGFSRMRSAPSADDGRTTMVSAPITRRHGLWSLAPTMASNTSSAFPCAERMTNCAGEAKSPFRRVLSSNGDARTCRCGHCSCSCRICFLRGLVLARTTVTSVRLWRRRTRESICYCVGGCCWWAHKRAGAGGRERRGARAGVPTEVGRHVLLARNEAVVRPSPH